MTKITMLSKGSLTVGFEISGHSGYAPAGKDIVCAGISMLSQAVAVGLSEVVDIQTAYLRGEGLFTVMIETQNEEKLIKSQILFDTMELSFVDLVDQYKDFVSICTKQIDLI